MTKSGESPLRIYLIGLLMGFADLIPGVSGGTVAFISGIYEQFLDALKSIDAKFFYYLITFRFRRAFSRVPVKFLFMLASGMATSILSLSKLIHYLLDHPVKSIYLFAFFLGILISSLQRFQKQIPKGGVSHFVFLVAGAALSLVLCYSFHNEPFLLQNAFMFHPMIMLSGFLATCAMLLPGISGSFVLLVLGMYLPTIEALSKFTSGPSHFTQAFSFLFSLGIGILLSMLISSRILIVLLQRFRKNMVSFLFGLMAGSMFTIWPFRSDLPNQTLVIAIFSVIIGFLFSHIFHGKKAFVQPTTTPES